MENWPKNRLRRLPKYRYLAKCGKQLNVLFLLFLYLFLRMFRRMVWRVDDVLKVSWMNPERSDRRKRLLLPVFSGYRSKFFVINQRDLGNLQGMTLEIQRWALPLQFLVFHLKANRKYPFCRALLKNIYEKLNPSLLWIKCQLPTWMGGSNNTSFSTKYCWKKRKSSVLLRNLERSRVSTTQHQQQHTHRDTAAHNRATTRVSQLNIVERKSKSSVLIQNLKRSRVSQTICFNHSRPTKLKPKICLPFWKVETLQLNASSFLTAFTKDQPLIELQL